MTQRLTYIACLPVLCLLAVGCEEEPDELVPDIEIEVSTRSVSGIVRDFTTGIEIEGVEVCAAELGTLGCGMSDHNGIYALDGLPADALLHIQYAHEDYVTLRWALDTELLREDADGLWFVAMPSTHLAETLAKDLGEELDPMKGMVLYRAVDGSVDGLLGATGALSGQLGSETAFYLSPGEEIDDSLLSTGSLGIGGFMNVEPGVYDILYSPPERLVCEPTWGWASNPTNEMEVEVVADAITFVEMMCQ